MGFINKYPYTDFHEMNLDFVINTVQTMLNEWKLYDLKFSDYEKAWIAMKEWIENYFDTLDVSVEINEKLDKMSKDGTLASLLAPFVAGASNPIIVNSIDDMTDHSKIYVLAPAGHIYSYTGTAFTDSGMTFSGINEIADLKKTNDIMMASLSDVYDIKPYGWVKGGLSTTSGVEVAVNYLIRSNAVDVTYLNKAKFNSPSKTDENYAIAGTAFFYRSDGTFIISNRSLEIPEEASHVRFTFGFGSTSGITIDTYGLDHLLTYWKLDTPDVGNKVDELVNSYVTDNKISAIFEIAEGYLNAANTLPAGDQILYAEGCGIYSEDLRPEGRTENGSSCSEFTMAVINGVKYEDSRYVQPKNYTQPWGFCSGGYGAYKTYGDYLTADEIYSLYKEKGLVESIRSYPYDGLKPGDYLLWVNSEDHAFHTGIVVQKRDNHLYYMNASDTSTSTYGRARRGQDATQPGHVCTGIFVNEKVFGGANFPTHVIRSKYLLDTDVHATIKRIYHDDLNVRLTFPDTSASIKLYQPEEHLPAGFYTIEAEDYGNTSYLYAKVTFTNLAGEEQTSAAYVTNYQMAMGARGHHRFVFYADCPIKSIEIRANGGGKSIDAKNLNIYKGFKSFEVQ